MLSFIKMEGCGNDYLFLDCRRQTVPDPAELTKKMSDRHFGVGGDGVVFLLPSQKANLRMRIFNADGSEGMMCGNAARCAARLAWDEGWVKKETLTLETESGIRRLREAPGGAVSLEMGKAEAYPLPLDSLGGLPLSGVSVGNPHAVLRVPSVEDFPLDEIARELRQSADCNLEIYAPLSPLSLTARVYERGSGETLACGTGAAAVLFAAAQEGDAPFGEEVEVRMPGGSLTVLCRKDGSCRLTGPAREVFRGVWRGASLL